MGHTLKHWEYGQSQPGKPALIFIHGFSGNHQGFLKIVPHLKHDYHVIAPDLPGFGESTTEAKSLSVALHAAAVAEFISSLGLKQPPILIGHSYGGIIVSRVHHASPEISADKTILISPIPTPVRVKDRRLPGKILGQLHYSLGARSGVAGTWWLRRRVVSRLTTRALVLTKDSDLKRVIYQEHFNNLNYLQSPQYYHTLYRETNKTGVDAVAPHIKKDVLIINGDKDPVAPLVEQQKIANLFDSAKISVIKGGGHLAHYEHPKEIVEAMKAFLKK